MDSPNLLLVSNHRSLADLVTTVAEPFACNVAVATDSVEALRSLEHNRCDAILLDERSLSSCPPIRSHWAGPIVLLVSSNRKNAILQGYEYGADSHISIPCDSRELFARIRAVIRREH